MRVRIARWLRLPVAFFLMCVVAVACGPVQELTEGDQEHEHDAGAEMLALPELQAVVLGGGPLRVVATTSLIGDVVAQVGGDAIELTTLMGPGQDPHSYEPAARDLTAVARAHVVLLNGWDLEEALVDDLEAIAGKTSLVPVSAYIQPLRFGAGYQEDAGHQEDAGSDEGEHHHEGADPHVWFSVRNVEQWVKNVVRVLSDLDPANAERYADNAAAYLAELAELDAYARSQFAGIPAEKRFLVTNHRSLAYLAADYDLQVLGTVIPATSTLAEPSARDLVDLTQAMERRGLCALFVESTVSDKLAQTVAAELDSCDAVQVISLYTGAIGPAGSGADSYVGMFRFNVDAIVQGLSKDTQR